MDQPLIWYLWSVNTWDVHRGHMSQLPFTFVFAFLPYKMKALNKCSQTYLKTDSVLVLQFGDGCKSTDLIVESEYGASYFVFVRFFDFSHSLWNIMLFARAQKQVPHFLCSAPFIIPLRELPDTSFASLTLLDLL